jgi:uncharacterized protein YndB with AHSA1/START domain
MMTNTVAESLVVPVRKSITVKASVDDAFNVFTNGFDSWWPRSHHIGTSPMKTAIVEGRVGGRCYTQQEDGTDCDWGSVLAWEPPHRVVLAWQITPDWHFQPDLAQSSEVEIRFTAVGKGTTRVDLEHRHLDRHGAGASAMRTAIDSSEGGWGGLLSLYGARVEQAAGATGEDAS